MPCAKFVGVVAVCKLLVLQLRCKYVATMLHMLQCAAVCAMHAATGYHSCCSVPCGVTCCSALCGVTCCSVVCDATCCSALCGVTIRVTCCTDLCGVACCRVLCDAT